MLPIAVIGASLVAPTPPPDPIDLIWSNLCRPYLLPRLRSVRVASESSYDRSGGNDDGFSGKYSFIRKEGDGLVIAELAGPGVVQRIWTPTPTDRPLEFYFDGEAAPRLSVGFRDLFLGKTPGFPEPLVSHGVGGFTSYVPIPYERSLKVVYRGPVMQFFQINHASLPAGAAVPSWGAELSAATRSAMGQASALLGLVGENLSARAAPPGAAVATARVTRTLAPRGSVTLLSSAAGGRLVGLRLAPASALCDKGRSIVLRMTWDGHRRPDIAVPVGDFFGASWGEPAMRSLFVGETDDWFYCWLPMPYARSCRVELSDERTAGEPIQVRAEVSTAPVPLQEGEGRFYAVWSRENPTAIGKPFTFVQASGQGHLVGVALQAQGLMPGSTPFFEGDDQATIDGALSVHGTGSEDFFNGGWYDVPGRWDRRVSLPLSGCLDYKKHLGRSAGYRFMVPDPVVFQNSLHQAIEHAPTGNDIATDYAGVAYLYADRPPVGAGVLVPAAERAVADPAKVVFAAGWNIPVQAFSFQNASLAKRTLKVAGRDVRALTLRASGGDVFGDHFVEVLCDLPAPGMYDVSIEAIAGPEVGAVTLHRDEAPVGALADLGAPDRSVKTVRLGAMQMRQGPNPVMLKLTTGATKAIGLDLVTAICERTDTTR